MEDLPKTMSVGAWCAFSYQACHVGDPGARLQLARLYKQCTHIKDNMRYALFWLVMANEANVKQGGTDVTLGSELSEEISAVAGGLSEREVEYLTNKAKTASKYSFGVSNQTAPSHDEVDKCYDEHDQYQY